MARERVTNIGKMPLSTRWASSDLSQNSGEHSCRTPCASGPPSTITVSACAGGSRRQEVQQLINAMPAVQRAAAERNAWLTRTMTVNMPAPVDQRVVIERPPRPPAREPAPNVTNLRPRARVRRPKRAERPQPRSALRSARTRTGPFASAWLCPRMWTTTKSAPTRQSSTKTRRVLTASARARGPRTSPLKALDNSDF